MNKCICITDAAKYRCRYNVPGYNKCDLQTPLNNDLKQIKMDKPSIRKMYAHYLELMELDETEMHEVQRVETKMAFYGGVSKLLICFKEEIAEMPEDKGVEGLESLTQEAKAFFINEVIKNH